MKKSNQKGITLIALVVTIIVLLILAGVSIAMLTGTNGILTRASQTAYSNDIGEGKDQVALAVAESTADYYAIKFLGESLDSKYGSCTTVSDIISEDEGTYIELSYMICEVVDGLNDSAKSVTYYVSTTAPSANTYTNDKEAAQAKTTGTVYLVVVSDNDDSKYAYCELDIETADIGSWINQY